MEELKGFKRFGFSINGKSGNQFYGDCPFCDKPNKFYVNRKNFLWDCKVCGKKGNYLTFLSEIHEYYLNTSNKDIIKKLSLNRELPISAFKEWDIGWSGSYYLIPVKNDKGHLQDLRSFRPGRKKLIGAPACSIGILGLDKLAKSKVDTPIYLCEGEWDTIALTWLLDKLNEKGIAVGIPGANTFKKEWIQFFKGREVYVMYDNDEAGENGQVVVKNRLKWIAKKLYFLNWIDKFPNEFDLRDLIKKIAVKEKRPKKCLRILKQMLGTETNKKFSSISPEKVEEEKEKTKIDRTVTLEKVYSTFKKWMHIRDTNSILVCLATVISNCLDGDPIWMFLVAPPGGSKTEIISSFDKSPEVYITSSLTSHALISGATFKSGIEPSMIPHLDGKTLIVKDFTTILTMRENEKDEIFGILRDAYDGKCGKVFGTGDHKYFESHFSMLCGVTTTIYEVGNRYSGLGERYLKYFIGQNLEHKDEIDIIRKAMGNVAKEKKMKDELSEVVYHFIALMCEKVRDKNFISPEIPEEYMDKLIALSQWGARMRGTVSREKYNTEMIMTRPSAEVGSRFGKNLAKLIMVFALMNGRKKVNEDDFNLIKKIALDTISQRNEDVLRVLYKSCPDIDTSLKTRDIGMRTRYPLSTTMRVLNDMNLLNIVSRVGPANRHEWTVSKYMRDLIKRSELYTTKEELNRPLKSLRRIILRKKK